MKDKSKDKITPKRSYVREDFISFRPSPETMRQLEELWLAWGETRSSTFRRCVSITYLLWKNGWVIDTKGQPVEAPPAPTRQGFKPIRIIEDDDND